MKRKYVALMLGTVLAFSSMSANAATPAAKQAAAEATTEAGTDSQKEAEVLKITGEVKAVDKDSITVATGTLKTEESESDTKADKQTDSKDASAKKKSDTSKTNKDAKNEIRLELTGKEEKLSLTKDTVTSRVAANQEEATKASKQASADQADKKDENTDSAKKDSKKANTAAADAKDTVSEKQTEKITATDIKVGDIVEITCSKDGKTADSILVLSPKKTSEDGKKSEDKTKTDKADSANNAKG